MKTRILATVALLAALMETLFMNWRTLAEVVRARTAVPWWDEWALIADLAQIDRGHALWPILWSSYWGERQVFTRLLWLANQHLFSLAPLSYLNVALQLAHVGLLMWLASQLIERGRPVVLAAWIVILNLLLSPFQMWNFVWGAQTMFIAVFLFATGAFISLARGGRQGTLLASACAILSSITMPNGLLVWPALVLQSAWLRRPAKVTGALAAAGSLAIGFYLLHYTRPEIGMGVAGMLRHPLDALLLTGLVAAGPLAFISNAVAAGIGVATLIVTAFAVAAAGREVKRPLVSAVIANVVFLVMSCASVVAGRLDTRFLGRDPAYSVPIRYPTLVSVLWVSIAFVILSTWRRTRWALAFYALPLFYLLFGTAQRQLNMAEDWADFFRATDAVGAALLMNAPDEELLSRLWPVRSEREERAAFLREKHLALFHEPRAQWIGRSVRDLFPGAQSTQCIGAIEKTKDLGGFRRAQGWAWAPSLREAPDYIFFTDASGRIIGHGRGGLRHGYIPGLLIEPGPVPASHAALPHSEWLAYFATSPDDVRLYGGFSHQLRVCAIQ